MNKEILLEIVNYARDNKYRRIKQILKSIDARQVDIEIENNNI